MSIQVPLPASWARQFVSMPDPGLARSAGAREALRAHRDHRTGHLTDALGSPAPDLYRSKANVTNVRNTASGYWKPYLKAGQRCLVPATCFSEQDRNTNKPNVFRW